MGMLGPNYLITLIPALCGGDGGMADGGIRNNIWVL